MIEKFITLGGLKNTSYSLDIIFSKASKKSIIPSTVLIIKKDPKPVLIISNTVYDKFFEKSTEIYSFNDFSNKFNTKKELKVLFKGKLFFLDTTLLKDFSKKIGGFIKYIQKPNLINDKNYSKDVLLEKIEKLKYSYKVKISNTSFKLYLGSNRETYEILNTSFNYLKTVINKFMADNLLKIKFVLLKETYGKPVKITEYIL